MKPLAITLLFLLLTGLVQSMAIAAEDKHQGFINNWTILGPFPNPERTPDAIGRGAFDVDYLASLGGEPKARIKSDTILEVTGDSQATTLTAMPAKPGEVVDFKDYYTNTDQKLVYAYADITAAAAQDGLFFLGSDDGAKVWVNGNLVLDVLPPTGRGYAPRQDQFNAKLNKGVNTILVKVENGMGDWKLGVEVYTGDTARKLQAEIKKEKDLREFQNQDLVPANVWPSYVFWPDYDGTPRIIWRDADRVRELIGNAPTQVRWFDSQLNEVEQPDKPGRYAAYLESKMNDGTPIRRSITFFNASGGLDPWADWGVKVSYIGKPFDPDAWKERSDIISRSSSDLFRQSLIFTETGAVFLSGLCEAKPNGGTCSFTDSPEVLHDDFHLALKMKLQKLDGKTRPLALPKDRSASPAPVLHEDTPLAAGVRMDAKEKIDAVCRQWLRTRVSRSPSWSRAMVS